MKSVPCYCVCKWRLFANPVTYGTCTYNKTHKQRQCRQNGFSNLRIRMITGHFITGKALATVSR